MRKASGWSVTSRISLISVHRFYYCHRHRMLLQSKTDTAGARGHTIWHNRHYISSPNVSSIVFSCVCLQQSQEYGQLTSGSSGGGSDSSSSRRRSKGRSRSMWESVRVPLLMFATILTSLTTRHPAQAQVSDVGALTTTTAHSTTVPTNISEHHCH